jgi:Na+/phosphate symporter
MDSYLERVNKTVKLCNFDEDAKLIVAAGGVKATFKEKRHQHLTRLQGQTVEPLISVSYMDILTNYRKINDHLINIAEVSAR